MREFISAALSRLKCVWRQVLAVHLSFTGLRIIVFAPLLGVLSQLLLKLSGEPALADMDLLFFALSPAGAFAIVVFVALIIVVSVFELASLMAVGLANAHGKNMGVLAALKFSIARVIPIFNFAARLVIRVLLIAAPFLAAGGLVALFLLSDYDINYYLAVRPSEFWLAAALVGIIVLAMAVLLVRQLIGWSLALPLVLFAGVAPAQSFSASQKLTQQNRGLILRSLLAWAAAAFLLGVTVTFCVRLLVEWLVPMFIGSVTALAVLFGLLMVLWTMVSVLVAALALGSLALLLAALANRLEPGFGESALPSVEQVGSVESRTARRRFALVLPVAVGAAIFIGFALLDEIQVVDTAEVIAHRGASAAAPENSMAAIRQAMVDGSDWIEIDVQENADGEVVVIHDKDFMKLAGVNLRVWEATTGELAEIDIGSWFDPGFADERVPRLADVLAEVKGRSRLIIELKYYGHDEQLEQRVIELVEAAEMQNDTMIMSLEYKGIRKVRDLRPDWKIGLLSARAIGDLTRLDADFLAVNVALAKPGLIRAAHAAGKELYVWTVNDTLSMSQMMSLGVDGIITDEPLMASEVLSARADMSIVERLLLHMAPLVGFEPPSLSLESNDAPECSPDSEESSCSALEL